MAAKTKRQGGDAVAQWRSAAEQWVAAFFGRPGQAERLRRRARVLPADEPVRRVGHRIVLSPAAVDRLPRSRGLPGAIVTGTGAIRIGSAVARLRECSDELAARIARDGLDASPLLELARLLPALPRGTWTPAMREQAEAYVGAELLVTRFEALLPPVEPDDLLPIDEAGRCAGLRMNTQRRCDQARRAAKWKRDPLPTVRRDGTLHARVSDCEAWKPKIESNSRSFGRNGPRNTPQRSNDLFPRAASGRKGRA